MDEKEDGQKIIEGVKEKNVLYWFRRCLRLHDNPALMDVLKDADTFRCIFILDPWFAGSSQVGINKWRWVSLTAFECLIVALCIGLLE